MAATEPVVSVVVPVRNRHDLLRRVLDALAAQAFEDPYEVIVVDDGSTDGAAELAEEWARTDPRFRVLHSGGRGAVAARRLGVAASSAPYLAFTDSDCEPVPGWLAAGIAALEAGHDLVQGRTEPAGPMLPDQRSLWSTRVDGLYPTCNVFYRRSAFDEAGGFDPDAGGRLGFRPGSRLGGTGFGEDSMVAWAVRRRGGRHAFVEEALVRHHVFPPDHRERLARAWGTGAFPALVRELPELRSTLLRGGVVLGNGDRLPVYVIPLAVLSGHRRVAAAAAAWWVYRRARPFRALARQPARAAKGLAVELAADVVATAALVAGSVRARSLVL